jgi:hypothetical protein
MLTKTKTALAAALLIGSASLALAAHDGDGNLTPGSHQRDVLIRHAPAFADAFASSRLVPATEWDGDGRFGVCIGSLAH